MPTPKLELITITIEGIAVETTPSFRSAGGASFLKLLSSYSLYRKQRTSDGQGGYAEAYIYSHTITGRLYPSGKAEVYTDENAQSLHYLTEKLVVLEGTDILLGDQIQIGSRRITVRSLLESSTPHHLQATCEEVQK